MELSRITQPVSSLRVSVVVPVYNGAATIADCIESLIHQDFPQDDYEVIIVENGSTDQTVEIVKRYPVKMIRVERRGPSYARNIGISCSRGDVVAFTDADCIAAPNWLSELMKPYADRSIGGAGGAILTFKHEGSSLIEKFSEQYSPLVNYISGEHEFLPHLYTANASYRRSLLNQVGGFNDGLLTAEDVDLAWRIQINASAKLAFAPESVIYHHHRTTQSGLSRQYRQYGYGEILLDALYSHHNGYPRRFRFQIQRISQQVLALPGYALSAIIRRLGLLRGTVSPYDALVPQLWLQIESNNVRGKIDALWDTRFMTRPEQVILVKQKQLLTKFFQHRKE